MKTFLLLVFLLIFNNFCFSNDLSLLSIPFDFSDNNLKIKVKVDGQEYVVIFDTGSHGIELDSQFENQLNSKKGIIDLQIQSFIFEKKLIKYRNWNNYISDEVDGIIGPDIFQPYSIEIDYYRKRINLFEENHSPNSEYSKLNIKQIKSNPQLYNFLVIPIEIRIHGSNKTTMNFLFDTGSSRNLTIFRKELSELDGVVQKRINASPHGFNRSINHKCEELNIQNFTISDKWIDFTEVKNDNLFSAYSGIVGNGILRNFNFYLNYEKSEFYFKKNEELFEDRLISDGIIIRNYTKSGEGLRIASILEESKNIRSENLQLNDEVLSISYQNKKISFEEYKEFKKVIGTQFTFEVKRKKKIFVVSKEVKVWD